MSKKPSTKILHPNLAGNAAAASHSNELLAALPSGIITVTRKYVIRYVNAAAEHFLGSSFTALRGHELAHFVYPATRLLELIDAAFEQKVILKEHDFVLSGPRIESRGVTLQVLPLDNAEEALIVIDDRGMAGKFSQHLLHRDNARSASGMASILAHEVKNPLSGIRGAAQLLSKTVNAEDKNLTTLICDEVDRIKNVIEEMEIFSDLSSLATAPVNIHEVLQYVRPIVEKGSGKVTFKESYDPSIPDVLGHRGLLIQLFLNIIKNAAEALCESTDPVITLATSYQSGFRVKPQESATSLSLPIVISVEDNGPGITADLHKSIFDPFVTTKEGGKGLGLAIAAKIVADHHGNIELDTEIKKGTRFIIHLPAA